MDVDLLVIKPLAAMSTARVEHETNTKYTEIKLVDHVLSYIELSGI
jgi:hypothetical protein